VVEMLDRILPVEDAEISAFARKAFEKQGMNDPDRRPGQSLKPRGRTASPRPSRPAARRFEHTVERVIVAVGIVANVEKISASKAQRCAVDRGHIVTTYGAHGRAGIYAIGDVAGAPWLAHKASTRRDLRRGDRGPAGRTRWTREYPGLHLLPSAGRQRRPDRSEGEGSGP
jgi:dihydrolipoamide dehydrogenase